jgi:hypothetical protein
LSDIEKTNNKSNNTDMAAKKSKKRSPLPTVPGPVGKAVEKAREVAEGIEAHGATVGLKSATAPQILALADDLNATQTDYQAVLASLTAKLRPELKAADEAANTFIIGAKKVIGFSLGDAWSPAWAEAGFLHDNLRTPTKTVDRIALLDRLAIYLASHPESQGKTQKITATQAAALHKALSRASRAMGHYDTQRKETRAARDKAKQALHKTVADVVVEIRRKLTADSPLWDAFGLTAPKPRAPRPRKEKVAKTATTEDPRAAATTKPTTSLAS